MVVGICVCARVQCGPGKRQTVEGIGDPVIGKDESPEVRYLMVSWPRESVPENGCLHYTT